MHIVTDPEFGDREGHTLVMCKALCGLHSSGLRWHEMLADCLRGVDFFPCKAKPDIWMRRRGNKCEHIAVCVDDLAAACEDPEVAARTLREKHHFKLKGTGTITFHLGCDFFRDKDGVLCIAPKKHIGKMISACERMFGSKPSGKKIRSPLERGATLSWTPQNC